MSAPAQSPLPSRTVLVVGIAVGAGALIAWLLPATAVVLVWPWLFALPGWILVRRVAPDLPRAGAAGVGVVASVVLGTHAVHLASLVVGFGRPAVLGSVVLLITATVGVCVARTRWLAAWSPPPTGRIPGEILRAVRAEAPAWLVAGATTLVVLVVLGVNGWRETPAGVVSGGWNWSDLLVHVAIGNSISHGNFPPEVPYFAGQPLGYHWFADFHGAIASTVADLPIIPVYFGSSAFMAGTLALVVWSLGMQLTGERRIATIAVILVVAGGGMGWIRLVGDIIGERADLVGLVVERPYDNSWADDWPFFRIASIFGTGFLPHRATTFGLPGLVAVLVLVVGCLERRPAGIGLAGLLAALLAPFHFYAFPATYLIAGMFVAFGGGWRARSFVHDAARFLVPLVVALPFVLDAALRQGQRGAFRFVQGWTEARFADGPEAALFFYATNLGLPVVIAVVGLLTLRGPGAPQRGFLGAWLIALFLVPNIVVVSAVEFDMNKYFQIMWIAAALLAAWWLARRPTWLVVAVLAFSAISPALIAVHHATHPAVVMSGGQLAAARWIETHTPERTVFATDDFINSPVDLAGRLRITTFGPYVANLGYDPQPRAADTRSIYCDGADVARDRLAAYGATYVLSPGGVLDCAGDPTDFAGSARFETVYATDGVWIWRVAGP